MHPAAGLRRQEMRDAIEQDFAKVPGLLDVLRMQADPASAPAVRDEPAEYRADPPAPSLWDMMSTETPAVAAEPRPPESPEEPAEPSADEPPPGQQRLF